MAALVMEAYDRFSGGDAEFYLEDVADVVQRLKALGLRHGALSRNSSLRELPSWELPLIDGDGVGLGSPKARDGTRQANRQRHSEKLAHLMELVSDSSSPQQRGRQLELIVHSVLQKEGLSPERTIINSGEEIDLAFVLEAQHYLVECKWLSAPVGFPDVRLFIEKIGRKAEGTFGVFLSMSGFVSEISAKANQGRQLNSVGLTYQQFVDVLEGRSTWSETVFEARRKASRRSQFL